MFFSVYAGVKSYLCIGIQVPVKAAAVKAPAKKVESSDEEDSDDEDDSDDDKVC